MAPEQIEGEKLTPAADVYAFGVILFEMLTGRLPFRGSTLAATALKRLRQVAPAPSSINPAINPAWDAIVLRCLERSVNRRWGSAREVLEALEQWEVRPALDVRRRRRARNAAILLGALLLAVAAGLAVWPWLTDPKSTPANTAGEPASPAAPPPSPEAADVPTAPGTATSAAGMTSGGSTPSSAPQDRAAESSSTPALRLPAPSAPVEPSIRRTASRRSTPVAPPSRELQTRPRLGAELAPKEPAVPAVPQAPAAEVPEGPLPIDTDFPR